MNLHDFILGKITLHCSSVVDYLIEYYKSAQNVLIISNDDLAGFLHNRKIREDIIKTFLEEKEKFNNNKKELIKEYLSEINNIRNNFGFEVISISDTEYPAQLRKIKNAPLNLYISGNFQFNYNKSIAIVGTRNVSPYAKEKVSEISKDLSKSGFCIISGLARGVDGQAHSSAIAANGKTIAVLPFLSSKIYPPEHTQLAKEIISNNGALISERFSLGKMYNAFYFTERNRIISGLSKAILIVEGAEKSGSLSQYNHAKRQNKIILTLKPYKENEGNYLPKKIISEGGIEISSAQEIIRILDKGNY